MAKIFNAIDKLGRGQPVLTIKETIIPVLKLNAGRKPGWRPGLDLLPTKRVVKRPNGNPFHGLRSIRIQPKTITPVVRTDGGVIIELLENQPLGGHHRFRDKTPGFSLQAGPGARIGRSQ